MPREWLEPLPVAMPPELAALSPLPLVSETLFRRGITSLSAAQKFLEPARYTPANPYDLPDMERAVERLEQAIRADERILIWGDFDLDGQTATALLVLGLRQRGAKNISYHVPHREREGHGIHIPTLTTLIDGVRVILTCDTGIAAHDAIDFANTHNIDVIVTDHHNLADTLPNAYANINPKRLADDHPLATLPGVGVAYELIRAMVEGKAGSLINPEDFAHLTDPLLDLVALGIVGDVAVQVNDARYLLQRGLEVLRRAERIGLRALMDQADIDPAQINEEHIGFAIAPRLNALGRLDDAMRGVELLISDDEQSARTLAVEVERLNAHRKSISDQTFQAALSKVENERELLDDPVLVLADTNWQAGIVGVVANKLVEQFNRPVILFAGGDDRLKGSARSMAGIDITAAITAVAHEQPDLVLTYGGHTMAAGLSIPLERLRDLRRAVNRMVKAAGVKQAPSPALEIAGYIDLADISLTLAGEIERLSPFGTGNLPLVLAVRDVTLKAQRKLGRTGDHLSVTVEDQSGADQRIIWWNGGGHPLPEGRFDVAFIARSRDYKGKREIQVEWKDWRPTEGVEQITPKRKIRVHDERQATQIRLAEILQADPDASVYVEGEKLQIPTIQTITRTNATHAKTLILWSIPPSRADLNELLTATTPQTIYLFAREASAHDLQTFSQQLGGVVKYALTHKGGVTTLNVLASAISHTRETVRTGLLWLQAKGIIQVTLDGDAIELRAGNNQQQVDLEQRSTQLKRQLEETSAWRKFIQTANADAILQ